MIALLVGVRAELPVVIERHANCTLDELTRYSCQIEDVDLQRRESSQHQPLLDLSLTRIGSPVLGPEPSCRFAPCN